MTSTGIDANSVKAIIAANVPQTFDELFPFVGVVKSLTRDEIKSDILAGLTVAAPRSQKASARKAPVDEAGMV